MAVSSHNGGVVPGVDGKVDASVIDFTENRQLTLSRVGGEWRGDHACGIGTILLKCSPSPIIVIGHRPPHAWHQSGVNPLNMRRLQPYPSKAMAPTIASTNVEGSRGQFENAIWPSRSFSET